MFAEQKARASSEASVVFFHRERKQFSAGLAAALAAALCVLFLHDDAHEPCHAGCRFLRRRAPRWRVSVRFLAARAASSRAARARTVLRSPTARGALTHAPPPPLASIIRLVGRTRCGARVVADLGGLGQRVQGAHSDHGLGPPAPLGAAGGQVNLSCSRAHRVRVKERRERKVSGARKV